MMMIMMIHNNHLFVVESLMIITSKYLYLLAVLVRWDVEP